MPEATLRPMNRLLRGVLAVTLLLGVAACDVTGTAPPLSDYAKVNNGDNQIGEPGNDAP